MIKPRKILVTSALLYSNGSLHLGHILEHVLSDIWVRFQRGLGHQCIFISGEDAHGTPIMLAAEKHHTSPEHFIQSIFEEHQEHLQKFYIHYDHFGSTHCPDNEALVSTVYHALKENDDITMRVVNQAYDAQKEMFLPDRYVQGICPFCNTPEQHGDNCEHCGATYNALDLKNPISVLSGTAPVARSSEQYFFKLPHYHSFLQSWVRSGSVTQPVLRKLLDWLQDPKGLQELAISREAPYFGFRIPDTVNKYFYVWLDAPIGYMAIFKEFCEKNTLLNFEEHWNKESQTELYHTIGKDIIKFHALLWPALLKGSHFRLPNKLVVHGYLTVEGRKMSKSRGTLITAKQYLDHLDPEYLRYYFASKINGTIEDIDLSWDNFLQKVNTELIGKLINIASRCAKLLEKHSHNQLSTIIESDALLQHFFEKSPTLVTYYETHQYHHVIRNVMELTDTANQYLSDKKPWNLIQNDAQKLELQKICTTGLNLFKILVGYLSPILPSTTKKAETFLNTKINWPCSSDLLRGTSIQIYQPILQRISRSSIEAITGPTN